YRLAASVGIVLGAYLAFAIGFYWMMQPSVAANSGMAAYLPPPKTVVHDANSPWIPPPASEARPTTQPDPSFAHIEPTAEPKKQTRRQERATARQTRPVSQQPNPFSAYGSSRSGGSRPWFSTVTLRAGSKTRMPFPDRQSQSALPNGRRRPSTD